MRKKELPIKTNTLNRTASIAKPITAVAIMQLKESKGLDLDSTVDNYLPEYKNHPYAKITVRHLLSHMSGVDAYASTKEVENSTEYPDLKAATKVFDQRELLSEPGTDYFYTSYGFVLLGRVIEEVSGQSYEDYVDKNIFQKAGMMDTGVEKFDGTYEGMTVLYSKKKKSAKTAKT